MNCDFLPAVHNNKLSLSAIQNSHPKNLNIFKRNLLFVVKIKVGIKKEPHYTKTSVLLSLLPIKHAQILIWDLRLAEESLRQNIWWRLFQMTIAAKHTQYITSWKRQILHLRPLYQNTFISFAHYIRTQYLICYSCNPSTTSMLG